MGEMASAAKLRGAGEEAPNGGWRSASTVRTVRRQCHDQIKAELATGLCSQDAACTVVVMRSAHMALETSDNIKRSGHVEAVVEERCR